MTKSINGKEMFLIPNIIPFTYYFINLIIASKVGVYLLRIKIIGIKYI